MVAGVYKAENKLVFCNCLLLYAQSSKKNHFCYGDEGTPFSHTGAMHAVRVTGQGVAVSATTSLSQPHTYASYRHQEHNILRQASQNFEDT